MCRATPLTLYQNPEPTVPPQALIGRFTGPAPYPLYSTLLKQESMFR